MRKLLIALLAISALQNAFAMGEPAQGDSYYSHQIKMPNSIMKKFMEFNETDKNEFIAAYYQSWNNCNEYTCVATVGKFTVYTSLNTHGVSGFSKNF